MKTLTENRIKGIPGFTRNPEHDFSDDGSYFIGFEYKGLPLTQCRDAKYGTYLCFRVDYIAHEKGFTYDDYSSTEWYHLCDKYNGVPELPEVEEIVKDLETVIAGIKVLEEKVKNEEIDYDKIVERAEYEIRIGEAALNKFKAEFNFWECESDWDLKHARDYVKSLQSKINRLVKLVESPKTYGNIRHIAQNIAKGWHIEIGDDNFYIEWMNEMLAKQAA